MADVITDDDRAIKYRGRARSVPDQKPLPRAGSRDDRSIERMMAKVGSDLERHEAKVTLYRYQWPDGRIYEMPWKGWGSDSTAQAWANQVGHKLIGKVPTKSQTVDAEFSPPPLVPADPIKPPRPPDSKPKRPEPIPPPEKQEFPPTSKKRPIVPVPRIKIENDYGIKDYFKEGDLMRTTMTESMPLISKWFGRVGKGLGKIPGLQGVGKAYEAIGEIADGLNLVYELVHDLNQAEAFEKGSKEVVKRVKPVKKIAEALIKKKYPNLPEPARKKAAEILEDLFEKYGSDPLIEKGMEKTKELDEGKDLDRTLFEDLKKTLFGPPLLRR